MIDRRVLVLPAPVVFREEGISLAVVHTGTVPMIVEMMQGGRRKIDVRTYQNDLVRFENADDVLTMLIHLGYLTYEEVSDSYDEKDSSYTGLAKIPNKEVRSEFEKYCAKQPIRV